MNLPRKVVVAAVVPALVAGALTTAPASARPTSGATAPVTHHQQRHFDARTVFRAIFFGHGPAAGALPGYLRQAPATHADTVNENRTMDLIERAYPGTIESVYHAVRSGSVVRAQGVLHRAASRLHALRTDPDTRAAAPSAEKCAVVLVAVANWVTFFLWWVAAHPRVKATDGIQHDRSVYDIVGTFS